MPPLPIGKVGEIMAGGFDQLGWHWWPTENAINSRVYDGRAGCVLHGKCMFGCPLGAKSSTDVTYWPKALANGAELITRARAQEISVDRRGRARGVVYFDREGRLQEQQASVVVVCCNGVGTPRLLLNSKSSLFPDGLANSSGNVGKYLMMHPYRFVDGLMAERTDGHLGAMGGVIFSQQFYETDYARGFARGYTLLVDRTFGPLTHALWGDVPWGRDHHVTMRRHFPHTIGMTVMSDDLPEERNRVELDGEVTDSNGIPAPRVIYRVGDNTEAMLQHGAERTHQVLEAAGAAKILDGGVPWFGSHLLGTARMGSDPLISVVNAWNQAHDVPNLFVVDGSSFTTSGGVNPTATIGALALRAADGIWDRRGEWP